MGGRFSFQASAVLLFVVISGAAISAEPVDGAGDEERVLPARIHLDDPVRFFGSLSSQTPEINETDSPSMAEECHPAPGESECPAPESALRMEPVTQTFEAPLACRWNGESGNDQEPDSALNTVRRLMNYGSNSRAQVYVQCPETFSLCWRDSSRPVADSSAAPVSANPFFVVLFFPSDLLLEEDPGVLSSGDVPQQSGQLSRQRRPIQKSYTFLEGNRRPSWKVYVQGY